MMRASYSRQRGTTLLEVMMSLAVILVGMLGLMRVTSVATRGASTGQRIIQAQARAQHIVEALRSAGMLRGTTGSAGVVIFDCLKVQVSSNWGVCEDLCRASLPAPVPAQACRFTLDNSNSKDSTGQTYVLVSDINPSNRGDKATWVYNTPFSPKFVEFQVAVGWNDDNAPDLVPQHTVVLRSAFYQDF